MGNQRIFVDDIYSKRKIAGNVLFKQLNNHHLNIIKFTIELDPSKFPYTKL